jgi:putative membrane protein
MGSYYWYGDMNWAGWLIMSLVMLVFVGLLVVAGIAAFRFAGPSPTRRSWEDDDAQRILDARYARGEIDLEEYRQRREVLGSRDRAA